MVGSDCPPITRTTSLVNGVVTSRNDLAFSTFAPRRSLLDQALVDAAADAGAVTRDRFAVRGVLTDADGRANGVEGHAIGSKERIEYRALWVVGADGGNSLIARSVEAETYEMRPNLGASHHTYWSGINCDGFRFGVTDDGFFYGAAPTHAGLTSIFIGTPDGAGDRGGDLDAWGLDSLDMLDPEIARQARQGDRRSRWLVSTDMPAWIRRPHGPGWVLVGDAGLRMWPATGHGITDALRDAELVADALAGDRPRLVEFEAARNQSAIDIFETMHGPTSATALQSLTRQADSFPEAIRQEVARGQAHLG